MRACDDVILLFVYCVAQEATQVPAMSSEPPADSQGRSYRTARGSERDQGANYNGLAARCTNRAVQDGY
jgi:hypothetical protein